MKIVTLSLILLIISVTYIAFGQNSNKDEKTADPEIKFSYYESAKRIDVMVDNKLFTSYIWPDGIFKAVLYPVLTSEGSAITRGYPLQPRAGERMDHPHQVGIWFNYGDVEGYDFWNNSEAIPREKKNQYGTIKHLSVEKLSGGKGEGILVTLASWVDPSGKELLSEKTEFHFSAQNQTRIIDRITTLTARGKTVSMKDNKEGMMAMRVARQLEMPSKEELVLTDSKGNPTPVKKMSNEGVTGNYRSSKGITGEAVWATRAEWMKLSGTIEKERVSVIMFDHPDNPGYPTYWHARGYGLFSANPLGWSAFTNGKENLNYSIPGGKSSTFRYRILIKSGKDISDNEINKISKDFAAKY